MTFTPQDDLLHDISNRERGRESLFWVFPVPDQQLLAVVYLWRDGPTGLFGRQVAVAESLSRTPLYFDAVDGLELEAGTDLDDCVVAGLHVRQLDPLRTVELEFDGDGFGLRARMTALHRPFSWHENPDGCPEYAADERFEQSMLTEGTFAFADRTVQFTGIGHRDHSWGSRDWRPLQHWKWMNASARDGSVSMHGWVSFALGERKVNGYINRGGEVTPIVAADVTHDLDDELMHTALRATLQTAAGDVLRLDATSVVGVPLPTRHLQLNEVACDATLDGLPAVAHIELSWPTSYVEDWIAGP